MKTKILDSIASREIDYVFSHDTGKMTSTFQKNNRLQKAMEKAYEWQNTLVSNTEVIVNDR